MDIIKFLKIVGKLKNIKRAGWVFDGVKNPESVSDHMFRTALMVLVLGENKKIDLLKSVKMALIHDIGESLTGDLIITEKINNRDMKNVNKLKETQKGIGVSSEEAFQNESKALKKLSDLSGNTEIYELWKEFEDGKTIEAKFVKEIDKLEMALQALEYEKEGNFKHPLERYYSGKFGAKKFVKDPDLILFLDNIINQRPNSK